MNDMNYPFPENAPSPSEEALSFQLQLDMKRREQRKRRIQFVTGFAVMLLALTGIVGIIIQTVSFFGSKKEEKQINALDSYNSFMLAVAAVDPTPFDDVTAASMEELIEISVWSILGADLEPSQYEYSSGELMIPAADVEAAFTKYFGSAVTISHQNVTGYGYEFTYSEDDNAYFIPLTTIEPLFTPNVTDGESKGDSVILTVGLINAEAWQQDSLTGKMVSPDPDKFIKVTLRQTGTGVYIGAIRTTALPETAIVEVFTTKPAEETTGISAEDSTSDSEETTTE